MAEPRRSVRAGASAPPCDHPPRLDIRRGDAIDVLAKLPAGFAQACITSPPYWGLRDYGVPARTWGGDGGCRHRWAGGGGASGRGRICRRCGAWRGCLGLEPDPDLYVEHLVAVLGEVRRALRDDGTLWLVLGDSFVGSRTYQVADSIGRDSGTRIGSRVPTNLKPKDLVGIPWRVAFALQADGWWLRSDTVWEKPNAMPESVRDRPTRAHEYVFLLAKSRSYFYDGEAVREPDRGRRSGNGYARPARLSYGGSEAPRGQRHEWVGGSGRNRRSAWTIPTRCFRGAHFATFPEALVEPCLLAGTSPAACSICGAPWRRIVDARRLLDGVHEIRGGWTEEAALRSGRSLKATGYGHWRVEVKRRTVGWEPSCGHDAPGARCSVLDPFAGTATTGLAAARCGRDFLGIELSSSYAQLARRRLGGAADCGTEIGARG